MCLVAHFSSGGRPGRRAAWVQARGRRGQNWPPRRPPPPPLARSFLFFLAPRLVPPRGGGGRGGLPASPCQGLVRQLGQPRAGCRGMARPRRGESTPAGGGARVSSRERAGVSGPRPAVALCSLLLFSLPARAPRPRSCTHRGRQPGRAQGEGHGVEVGCCVVLCVWGVSARAAAAAKERVGRRRRRVARLPRSLARSLSLRFKKGIAAQTAPLPEPFRARPPPSRPHAPAPAARPGHTAPDLPPFLFPARAPPPPTHHPAPMAPAPKPRGAPLLSAAAVAKRAKLVADGAAWASNVLSSVLIIFVNKALMGSAGYGFAYGAWARGCRRERGGRGGERAGASAPAFFSSCFPSPPAGGPCGTRPRALPGPDRPAFGPAIVSGMEWWGVWPGPGGLSPRAGADNGRAGCAFFFFFFFFKAGREKLTPRPRNTHTHTHTHTHSHDPVRPALRHLLHLHGRDQLDAQCQEGQHAGAG